MHYNQIKSNQIESNQTADVAATSRHSSADLSDAFSFKPDQIRKRLSFNRAEKSPLRQRRFGRHLEVEGRGGVVPLSVGDYPADQYVVPDMTARCHCRPSAPPSPAMDSVHSGED